MATDAAHRARHLRLPLDTLSRIAVWVVVVALLMVVGIRAATRFDAWYLAGSIVPSDTRVLCPIDLASVSTGGSYAGC